MRLIGDVARGALLSLLAMPAAMAGQLSVRVLDVSGKPVPNAVVYAEPAAGHVAPKVVKQVEIEQKEQKFFPLVSVVQAGTPILFPNHDKVRHHVYSFSPAKTFELKLYSGVPGTPVLFDKPGLVVLGCNIHDQMVAYVQVVNTPYFAKTGMNGNASLEGLPAGQYTLKAWYFKLAPNAAPAETNFNYPGGDVTASLQLSVKAVAVE